MLEPRTRPRAPCAASAVNRSLLGANGKSSVVPLVDGFITQGGGVAKVEDLERRVADLEKSLAEVRGFLVI